MHAILPAGGGAWPHAAHGNALLAHPSGGEGNCGYLKSSGGKPNSYTKALALASSRDGDK